MKKSLQVLNELEKAGELSRYAIGGAMGALFYIEPTVTYDLDIFVVLPEAPSGLVTLTPLYEALRRRGFEAVGEFVEIESVPVQFLPVYSPLLEEALADARDVFYEDIPTRVLRAEHLVAICLQTGREKDRNRVRLFFEQAELDTEFLASMLIRYQLEEKWRMWIS
jgi:hypothetical protein